MILLLFSLSESAAAQSGPGIAPVASEVAGDGAWCWFSDPRAVYHKGRRERIYFGFINSQGDVVISARDMQTKAVETFVLHEKLQVDDHNVPAILFLPDGSLLTFYTEHNGRSFMRRSRQPEDISAWEEEEVLPFGSRITYAHPVMLSEEKNRIYLFWRGSDWRPTFSYSEDGGRSWSPVQALIDGRGMEKSHRPYLKVASDGRKRIDFAFTDGHPNAEASNSVYHIYYQKGHFYQSNGSPLGTIQELPLKHAAIHKVYDAAATKERAWIADIALDKKNRPVLVYTRFPSLTDHRYYYAAWNGNAWEQQELCAAGGWMPVTPAGKKETEHYYSGGISLDHARPEKVVLARQLNGRFEIESWMKKGKSWKIEALTKQSAQNNMRPYVVENYKGKVPLVLWMGGHYEHYTRFNTRLYLNR
ncbi:MAG: BNR-4 repeat-containing protein [Adhaeribacter sp.]